MNALQKRFICNGKINSKCLQRWLFPAHYALKTLQKGVPGYAFTHGVLGAQSTAELQNHHQSRVLHPSQQALKHRCIPRVPVPSPPRKRKNKKEVRTSSPLFQSRPENWTFGIAFPNWTGKRLRRQITVSTSLFMVCVQKSAVTFWGKAQPAGLSSSLLPFAVQDHSCSPQHANSFIVS